MSRYTVAAVWGDVLAKTRDLRSAAAVYVDATARGIRAVGVYDEDTGEPVGDDALYDALDPAVDACPSCGAPAGPCRCDARGEGAAWVIEGGEVVQ